MSDGAQAERLRDMAFPRVFDTPKVVVGVAYLAAYALLDWISAIEPYALSISPWNPGIGLSFVLLLLFGRRMIPFVLASPLLADVLQRQLAMPWAYEILSSLIVGGGYSAAAMVLLRPGLNFDPALSSMRDLMLLMLVATASAAGVAVCYVGIPIAAGLLPAGDFAAAALRSFVGDVIGIMVVTPFALFALTRRRPLLPLSLETAAQFLAIALALALVFGFAEEQQFQLFYVLFLPIVWIAVRAGSEGVSVGLLATQLGLILGIQFFPAGTFDLTSFQALMLVLAATGLVAGELVTERRRTESQLRLHQESLSRLARLGSMGELAAAVAHELNQPLMAAGTYTRLVDDAIATGGVSAAVVADTAKKAVAQVERAAEVVRRLRALVRLDRSNRAPCRFERVVKETLDLCQPDLDRAHIAVRATLAPDLPPLMIDLLQIEQALINLVRNAIEAIRDGGAGRGTVTIEAKAADTDMVEVRVADTGPGFPPHLRDDAFLPLSSDKAEGLGIGLSLCKSIIEAHGGQLTLEGGAQGAVVRFTLPIAKPA